MFPSRLYHVSSSRNRASILEHGLDWTRMGPASGIAGSRSPEQEGCFLCRDEDEVEWFLAMNNTDGAVDVWAVHDIDVARLVELPEGYRYLPGRIPPEHIELVRAEVVPRRPPRTTGSTAFDPRQQPIVETRPGLFFDL